MNKNSNIPLYWFALTALHRDSNNTKSKPEYMIVVVILIAVVFVVVVVNGEDEDYIEFIKKKSRCSSYNILMIIII